ncbi:PREDICTED: putative zinc metalloprotease slr1821-like isoform 2 [Fragaria vesca subsp. vesca]
MVISLSSSPPSSLSLIKLTNSRSEFPSKPKTHLPKCSFSSSDLSFHCKDPFLSPKGGNPNGTRLQLRSCALPGLDYSNFESVQSVLEAAAVLTAIIVVHESGHFLAAYLQGIHVSKFAVGFGPILAKFNANNVEYSIRAFPLGGFVGFPDNDPNSDIPVDDVNLLKNRPILDRVIVVSAGVIANIIFAYAIIFTQVLSVGLPVQEGYPGVIVPEVRPFSAASRDGLLAGDVILEVNGIQLPKGGPNAVTEVVDVIKKNPNRNVVLKVERGKQDFEIGVTPDENYDGTGKIGVQLSPNVKISKTASKVSGPVAIIAVGAEVARSNLDGLYQFAALLNLNLAVINLLPLPALDGGTLAFILIEAARGGRKLPMEVEQTIMSSGITVVVFLGLFLIVRDTLNLDFIRDML